MTSRTTDRTLQLPCIHLNGTSRGQLSEAMETAYCKIGEAMDALKQCAPHGRDYYPLEPGALDRATEQHWKRMSRLQSIREDLEFIVNNM